MPATRPTLTFVDDQSGGSITRDRLSPPLKDFSSRGIQAVLKSRIRRSDMDAFLERKLGEDTIDGMRSLLDLDGETYSIPGETAAQKQENDYQRKRAFDMAMIAIYEDLMTPEQAAAIISPSGLGVSAAADLLEKMAVLEYNLYYLNKDLTSETLTVSEGVYVSDSVLKIYYADPTRNSYQSLENAEAELQKIYDGVTDGSAAQVLAVASDFDYKALASLNGRRATVEGSNIGKYKFLLNYTTTSTDLDRDLARKYWAITSDGAGGTYGYYVRDGRRVYLSGLTGYSYYGLLSSAYNSNYKSARDFLVSLRAQMSARTIHY